MKDSRSVCNTQSGGNGEIGLTSRAQRVRPELGTTFKKCFNEFHVSQEGKLFM